MNDVAKIVSKLNDEIFLLSEVEEEAYILTYITDGYDENVDFLGHCIWSSSDDEREMIYESDEHHAMGEYEDLENYLRERIIEEISVLVPLLVLRLGVGNGSN